MRQEMETAFKSVDLIISPTAPTPAFRIGEKIDDPLAMYLSDIYTATANLTLNPAISVPFGAALDGRPVGVQFMAPYMGELLLFQISHILENLR
jgi:aspartyl-tRNA(Asn)/glutamyl-tRNA(Gln) amidotransferase subunit A